MAIFGNPTQEFETLKRESAKGRQPHDRDAWLNLAFYLDEQYVEFQEAKDGQLNMRRIPRRKGEEDEPRPVVNKIMQYVNQQQALMSQNKPTVDVLPATEDTIDAGNAEVARAFLRNLLDPTVADFGSVSSEAILWALVAGRGWIKWVYNERLKRVDLMAPNYFDVYVDPYAKSLARARYIIHSQFMDVEQVYDIYGVEVKATGRGDQNGAQSSLLEGMGCAPVNNGVIVNELWMRPSRRHPKGRFVVWTDRTFLVSPQDHPYEHKELPFTDLGSIPRPGSQHYASAIKWLRPPQMELNKYHAQRIKTRQAFASPKWWIPENLELVAEPDSSPNQILRGSGPDGVKPEIIQPSAFAVGDEGQWLTQEMMDVVGQHEVSQGQVPGRVEAAKAIEMLRESDASRLSVLTRTLQSAISIGGHQSLMLAQQYIPEEQIIKTYSRDGMPQVHKFKTSDFNKDQRVRVMMGTGLSGSRSARMEEAMQLWQAGVIRDPQQFSEFVELPAEQFNPQSAHDRKLARNENVTLFDGKAITPNSWDNHALHIEEHNNARKTEQYLTSDEETKNKFEHHVKTHEDLEIAQLEKEIVKNQKIAMLTQPAPPGAEGEQPAPAGAAPPQEAPPQ